jgi:hypothetical protein
MRWRVVGHEDDMHRKIRALFRFGFIVAAHSVAPAISTAAPPQTLRLDALEVVKTHRELRTVRVVVRNITSEPQSGVVWYVLAAPEEPEPWRINAYASPERELRIAPGKTATVELDGPGPAVDGVFELSVWLHGVVDGTSERFHSDFKEYGEAFVVGPPFSFAIDIFQTDGAHGAPLLVRFSVRNNETASANIGFLYRIGKVAEKLQPTGSFHRTARIASGVDYVVTAQHREPLPPGSWKATGWLFDLSGAQPSPLAVSERLFEVKD